jgi:hypothetical protein
MIKGLFNLAKAYVSPPKVGDVYYGHPIDLLTHGTFEGVLHGLRARGGDALWDIIPSSDAYRLTVMSTSMPYYICQGEVLAQNKDTLKKEWMPRSHARRIRKEIFRSMLVEGRIEKK